MPSPHSLPAPADDVPAAPAAHLVIWGWLGLITLAEALVAFGAPEPGLWLHVVILLGLAAHVGLAGRAAEGRLALALMLAPLIRLLSLGLPLGGVPLVLWYPIVGAPLLLAAFAVVRRAGLGRAEIGLSAGRPLVQIALAGCGMAIGAVEYLILRPPALGLPAGWAGVIAGGLALLIFTGLLEELIFRGLLQRLAPAALGAWGLTYVSLLFAVLHLGHRSLLDVIFVYVIGRAFAQLVRWGGSILGVTLAHGLANITLYILMPAALLAGGPWAELLGGLVGAGGLAGLVAADLLMLRSYADTARRAASAPTTPIRGARLARGLTCGALARQIGLPVRDLASIEHGLRAPSSDELARLRKALGGV